MSEKRIALAAYFRESLLAGWLASQPTATSGEDGCPALFSPSSVFRSLSLASLVSGAELVSSSDGDGAGACKFGRPLQPPD